MTDGNVILFLFHKILPTETKQVPEGNERGERGIRKRVCQHDVRRLHFPGLSGKALASAQFKYNRSPTVGSGFHLGSRWCGVCVSTCSRPLAGYAPLLRCQHNGIHLHAPRLYKCATVYHLCLKRGARIAWWLCWEFQRRE